MYKAEQDRRLIQFLMGLNKVYTIMRGNILMMTHLPSMGQAFALLVQEEKQREIRPHNQMLVESASVAASASGTKTFKTNCTSNTNTNEASSSRSRLFCEYCKRSGHIKDKCYRLHGYPSQPNQGQCQIS